MQPPEPDAYLAQRIRETVAAEVGQLGLHVEITGDLVILRGRLDAEPLRTQVRDTAQRLAQGRRVVDETERPAPDDPGRCAATERIDR